MKQARSYGSRIASILSLVSCAVVGAAAIANPPSMMQQSATRAVAGAPTHAQAATVISFDTPPKPQLAQANHAVPATSRLPKMTSRVTPFLTPPEIRGLVQTAGIQTDASAPPLMIDLGRQAGAPFVYVNSYTQNALWTYSAGAPTGAKLSGDPQSLVLLEMHFRNPTPHALLLDCAVTTDSRNYEDTVVNLVTEVHAGVLTGDAQQISDLPLLGTSQVAITGPGVAGQVTAVLLPTPKVSQASVVLYGDGRWWFQGCQLTPVS